jgi:GTP-binding protein
MPAPSFFAEFSPEQVEYGEHLFRRPCSFLKGVVEPAGLPGPRALEVAFAGRSNVGKSSLLNALVGRKALARTSNTPGRTREINYFELGDDVYLVDLPGYGYARAPKREVGTWNRLIRSYLKGRAPLARVFLLIDARHGLKATDKPILELMDLSAVSYQGVLTKADKLKQDELASVSEAVARELTTHPAAHPELIVTSARSGLGLPELRAAIATLLGD